MNTDNIKVRKLSHKKIKLKYHVDIISDDRTLVIKSGEEIKIGYEYKNDKFSVYGLQRFNNPIRILSQKYAVKMMNIRFLWKEVDINIPEFGNFSLNIPINIVFNLPKAKIRDEKIKRVLE